MFKDDIHEGETTTEDQEGPLSVPPDLDATGSALATSAPTSAPTSVPISAPGSSSFNRALAWIGLDRGTGTAAVFETTIYALLMFVPVALAVRLLNLGGI